MYRDTTYIPEFRFTRMKALLILERMATPTRQTWWKAIRDAAHRENSDEYDSWQAALSLIHDRIVTENNNVLIVDRSKV